jgi:hypothetical protein
LRKKVFVTATLAAVVGTGCLLLATARSRAASHVQMPLREAKCPARPVPPLYGTVDEVIAAARRLLVHGFVSAQGHTIQLTTKNSAVEQVVVLVRTATPIAGAASLRADAASRCGMETALSSWAVRISVPAAMPRESSRLAFLLKTRRGWRTY